MQMDLGFGSLVSVCYSVIPMKSVVETIVFFKAFGVVPWGKSCNSKRLQTIKIYGYKLTRQ